MKFCTVINCMDGRVQLPVINYLKQRFDSEFVDSITEAGPNLILADQANKKMVDSILAKISISVKNHGSRALAVAGHHDCAGNPVPGEQQIEQIKKAVLYLKHRFPELEVIGIWVDDNWQVQEQPV